MKRIAFFIIILAIIGYFFIGNNPFNIYPDDVKEYVYTTSISTGNETLTIGTFNIQTFGQAKIAKEDVMETLSEIACKFDILSVQEIRDVSGETPVAFMEEVDKLCSRKYILSERLGRSSSKESYMVIYNDEEVSYVNGSAFAIDDEEDLFEREPYIAKFETDNYDFFLVSIHVKPEDAENEIKALSSTASDLRLIDPEVIILGDLNADCTYFDETTKEEYFGEGYTWKITNEIDTTTKSTDCTYDRIIVSDEMMSHYADARGVYQFDKIYNLDHNKMIEVSDHYPVWANFKIK